MSDSDMEQESADESPPIVPDWGRDMTLVLSILSLNAVTGATLKQQPQELKVEFVEAMQRLCKMVGIHVEAKEAPRIVAPVLSVTQGYGKRN